uniref:Ycf19 n=1 Tax=Harveyella mirabilis TaxID=282355 RepID=A0A3S8UW48_9FLOR|nr:hypothetical protein [Harveyella mirabilis]
MNTTVSSLNITFMSIANCFEIYLILICLKLLLMSVITINWYSEPFYSLHRLTYPYLEMFKGTIPMIFNSEISHLISLMFLEFLAFFFHNIRIESIL